MRWPRWSPGSPRRSGISTPLSSGWRKLRPRAPSCSCCRSARSPGTCSTAPRRRCRTRRRSPARRPRRSSANARGSASTRSRGLLERDGDTLYNAAILVGPDGLIGSYRKTHLPFLGVDRFVTPGDEFKVFDTALGRIGLIICYDLRFPEVTRTLALHGADIVALPTNFPMAAKLQCDVIAPARAAENRIYLLVANRVGKERWGEFCGWSQIVDPYGTRLAEAGETEETLLVADVELEKARDKDYVVPGEYELYLFGHRRPELYGALVEEESPVEA